MSTTETTLPALAAQLTTLNDLLESAVAVIEAQAVWTLRIDGDALAVRVSFDEAQRWARALAPQFPESKFEIVTV